MTTEQRNTITGRTAAEQAAFGRRIEAFRRHEEAMQRSVERQREADSAARTWGEW